MPSTSKKSDPSASSARAVPVGDAIFEPFNPREGAAPPKLVVAPSLLSSDFAHAARELARCKNARARWVHVDVMDGYFVPNMTLGPPILKQWRAAEPDLFYDVHLMVERPLELAEAFVLAGANNLTLHIETIPRGRRELRAVKKLGARASVTLKPKTPVKAILDVLDEVDMVLVMSVEPGFGGQELIPKTLNKVRELDLFRRREKLKYRLEIDGGINRVTAPLAVAAGADVLVAGHALFGDGGNGNLAANLKAMRGAIAQARPTNVRV